MSEPSGSTSSTAEPEREEPTPQGDCSQPGGCVSTPTIIVERPARKRVPVMAYSRIVGYLTPVESWNLAKKQEYRERKLYDPTKVIGPGRE